MASEAIPEVKQEVMETDGVAGSETKPEVLSVNGSNGQPIKEETEEEGCKLKVNGDVEKQHPKMTRFKVKVSGLPKFYPLGEFKRLVKDELGLALNYMRCPKKGNPWLHLTFSTAEDQEKALKALNKFTWRRKTLSCNVVTNDAQKRKPEDWTNDNTDAKKAKLDMTTEERVLMITIPYHHVPYEEQLKKKTGELRAMVQRLGDLVSRHNPELAGWAEQQKEKNNGLLFELEEIRPSPIIDAYRNKCEFRIGLNPDTQERTVGCRLENLKDGSIGVGPADSLKHLPDQMKEAVKLFQEYVRKSDKEPFCTETRQGYWRHFVVRVSCNNDVMLIVVAHPQSLSDEDLTKFKNDIKDYFVNREGSSCNITSLYFQKFTEKLVGVWPMPEMELLHGKTHLEEPLLDLTFHLSPTSYFQVNTKGAEVLYSAIIELVKPTEETTILDLCCGTGGIGLCIAKKCGQVLGIEYLAQNIEDAKYTAAQNNITNCEYFAGRVEEILPTLGDKITGKTVVPILDPPRTGLSQKVIAFLRKFDNIQKLIYVCSNHKAPIRNFLDLCCAAGKHTMTGNPFVPVKTIPVDVVPHTMHAQMVILLERVDPKTLPKAKNPPIIRESRRSNRGRGGRGAKGIAVVGRGLNRGGGGGNSRGLGRGLMRGNSHNYVRGGRIRNVSMEVPNMNNMRGAMRGRGMGLTTGNMRMPLLQSAPSMGRGLLMTPPLHERRPPLLRSMQDSSGPSPLLDHEIPPLLPSYGVSRRHRMDFSSDELTLSRYSDFRRDVEDAIDSSLGRYAMGSRRGGGYVGGNPGGAPPMREREEMLYRSAVPRGVGFTALLQTPSMYSQYGQMAAGRFKGSAGNGAPANKRGGISRDGQGNYRGRGGYR